MGIGQKPISGGSSYSNPDVTTAEFVANYTRGGATVYGIEIDCGEFAVIDEDMTVCTAEDMGYIDNVTSFA